jgi:hypothetical protein
MNNTTPYQGKEAAFGLEFLVGSARNYHPFRAILNRQLAPLG